MNRSDEKKVQEKPVKIAILEGSSLGADMDFSPFMSWEKWLFIRKHPRKKCRNVSGMWTLS